MTALMFDGFDHDDKVHRWTASDHGVTTTTVRTGTRSLRPANAGATYYSLNSTQEDDVMYVGFGFNSSTGGKATVMTFSEGHGSINHVSLVRLGDVRGWEIRRGIGHLYPVVGTGTVLVAELPNIWFPDSWHYVEFAAKIHDTAGWVEMRQDGITRMRFDGDTSNGGTDNLVDQITFGQVTGAGAYLVDDVYLLNEQGSTNNSWLGDTRCYPLYPNGNGTSSTPLSGSDGNSVDNYLLVDEPGTPVTTDYVFSNVPGDQDTYTFENLPVSVGTIRGVEIRMHAAKEETGTKQIGAVTRRSGTDSFGPDHPLAAIPLYQTHYDLDELDPHAGPGTWTISNINATEWGVEVRA